MLNIYPVLCRAGYMDNYCYIIVDSATKTAAVVDASEAPVIIDRCRELGITPQYIFNTHHHFDHTDGNQEIKAAFNAKVVGNAADKHRIPALDLEVKDGETFTLGASKAQIIDVSAHTQGHILWYFPADKIVFTGDTLFNLCIGGLFEGTPAQMFAALQKIKQLPDDTVFYPGHEYTMPSASFALQYNHNNDDIRRYLTRARQRLAQGLPVAPVTLGEEKRCNPYLEAATLSEFCNIA